MQPNQQQHGGYLGLRDETIKLKSCPCSTAAYQRKHWQCTKKVRPASKEYIGASKCMHSLQWGLVGGAVKLKVCVHERN
jgi:hypothetical protein